MATILQPNLNTVAEPYTDLERKYVNDLRILLKDVPLENYTYLNTLVEDDYHEHWTDPQLLVFLTQSLNDINSEPPLTGYNFNLFPQAWRGTVMNGGLIYALIAEGILSNSSQFSYSDNGISLQVNLTQGYTSIAQMLLQSYHQSISNIKRSMRPMGSAVIDGAPPARIRSYAPRIFNNECPLCA